MTHLSKVKCPWEILQKERGKERNEVPLLRRLAPLSLSQSYLPSHNYVINRGLNAQGEVDFIP